MPEALDDGRVFLPISCISFQGRDLMRLLFAERDESKCMRCGACDEIVACSSSRVGYAEGCIGCGACQITCPCEAIEMRERDADKEVKIRVNGEIFRVPARITVKKALEILGYESSRIPSHGRIFAPCEVGGCYSCALLVDGEVMPSCVTGVKEGMSIRTELPEDYTPVRRLHGWMGHRVGGVGTPWHLKNPYRYVEAAVFACGCNLRCPQCQNWRTTYNGRELAFTPREAAMLMTDARIRYGVDRMAISGGESTLNRPWLIQYIRELRRLNPSPDARIHVDTNGTLLTEDYIDEMVDAGLTDIGPDLKGLRLETFMRITGIHDKEIAEVYRKTGWNAVKYIIDNYKDRIFMGVGVPYSSDLISLEEIEEIGEEICRIDDEVQLCVLDYRPEFRSRIRRPSYSEMLEVHGMLKGIGLKTVICQTAYGYIGP